MALPAETLDADILKIARLLTGADVEDIVPATGGGNNRVFRISAGATAFALKCYPDRTSDTRDRLGAEFKSLGFLKDNGVEAVPAAIACDREKGAALYEWIDGEKIEASGDGEIDAALAFMKTLSVIPQTPEAIALPLASEACLSAGELVRQIDDRVKHLQAEGVGDGLSEFLNCGLPSILERFLEQAERAYEDLEIGFDEDIPQPHRILSPSDFGLHNALRRSDGSIVFLDFEYFGWDDPVKLVSDFLLHPGQALSHPASEHFFRGAAALYGTKDAMFTRRLDALYPLYGIRWCLIILTEFLPNRMALRQLAGRHPDPDQARRDQLGKAQALLANLNTAEGGFFHDH